MEIVWLLFAFVGGLSMKQLGLPPLIGFLGAGFLLNYFGFESSENLQSLADLGITLMLFTIGLKLNIRDLLKPEVWITSAQHLLIWVLMVTGIMFGIGYLGLSYLADMSLQQAALLAFALSFSSTVCVVKILEESGEMKTRHGKIAIGVLVMQDIFAVLFLVFAAGKTPTLWAFALFALWFARPIFYRLINSAGHGELLPLTGFLFALGGYHLFDLVGVKGDLGALIMGMLIAPHVKASELSKSLLSFKDLFLVGFFLSIGLIALPDMEMVMVALLLCVLVPLKFLLFFTTFVQFKLRARTAYLSGLVLSNFSEFGLIVAALAVSSGWFSPQWLVIIALSVSFSFIFTSLRYKSAHSQYLKLKSLLRQYESNVRLKEDIYQQPEGASVLLIGMGRVGRGAFSALSPSLGDELCGVDADPQRVRKLQDEGLKVIVGDGEDADMWENVDTTDVRLILLALPSIDDTAHITQQLRVAEYQGKIAAIARYDDEVEKLMSTGTDYVFNMFTEAGAGLAEESLRMLSGEGEYEVAKPLP
ncbi:cation:proton antiporter family protein [Paraglaciecola sp. 20A4]|uniref:cation:proton antiporter family protein n=1 Tax=Paraglaciecola sp. 20A4 TaxID=2687288 RepID=UPI00140C6286|nr:cation:proton antiporter family protein [Paraglaciecola sp. 20A4]